MTEKLIWFNGELIPADQAKVSVFDHGLLYGDGVFEGIRIYQAKVFKLRTHLKRLYDGAAIIDLPIPYSIDELFEATRRTVVANGLESGYIRLVVTRGVGTLGLNPYLCDQPTVFIIADGIQLYPQEYYEYGLKIITAKTRRNHPQAMHPAVKSMNYLNNIFAKVEAIKAEVLEAIMLNQDDNVAECTGDNLFMVKDGQLITPPLSAGILPGITRSLVLELAAKQSIPAAERDFKIEQLYAADECFLTGSAAEVVPVTVIDSKTIGEGQPGPITQRLYDAYHTLVSNDPPED